MNISEFEKEIEKSYSPQFPNREFKISLQKSFRTNEDENKLNIRFNFIQALPALAVLAIFVFFGVIWPEYKEVPFSIRAFIYGS